MIHHVRGTLVEKAAGRVVVEVGGLGLELLVSDGTWSSLGAVGDPVHVLAHLAVRDDAWTLFGFSREEERAVFRLLLGVQGIGPRLALSILSGVSTAVLLQAVQEGDVAVLTAVSGVGKKTAQRIIVDLRDKVGALPGSGEVVPAAAYVEGGDEAVDALVALGYSRHLAREAVRDARSSSSDEETSVEVVIRDALRRI